MKILHVGDIHLGAVLEGISRNPELKNVLEYLVQIVRDEHIEAALLAGDVFDNGQPSSESQGLYYDFLAGLKESGCRQVVAIAGNHDSPKFLDAPGELLRRMHITVVGNVAPGAPEREVVELTDSAGLPSAVVCAVPFLHGGNAVEHYREVLAAAEHFRRGRQIPIIGMGHLYAAGSLFGSKQPPLSVGTLESVAVEEFASGFDYLALGHVHRAQSVLGHENWRYAGSLVPMNVREGQNSTEVVVLDTAALDHSRIHRIPPELYHPMIAVSGATVEELRGRLSELAGAGRPVWVKMKYTGDEFLPNWSLGLQQEFRESALWFVRPDTAASADGRPGRKAMEPTQEEVMREVSPEEIFETELLRAAPQLEKDEAGRERYLGMFRQAYEAAKDPSRRREAPGRAARGLMRFKSLYVKNVNSLYGEHLIEFDAAEFAKGVFLIAGRTGAGKSSILDAICLALYGRTPRVNVTGNSNPVMSKGEHDMAAALSFTIGAEDTYLACFKQHCGGGKQNLQPIEHVLFKNGIQLPPKAKEVPGEIEKLIGMKVEQFTQCVLLAQGNFDKFLKAKEPERAAILTKITGIDECDNIGRKINELFQANNQEFGNLESRLKEYQGMMADNERQLLEAELAAAQKDYAKADRDCMKCQQLESNFQRMEMAERALQVAEASKLQADAALRTAAPERTRLAQAERAQKCQDAYHDYAGRASEVKALANDRANLIGQEPVLKENLANCREKCVKAEQAFRDLLAEQSAKSALFQEVRKLDAEIAAAQASDASATEELTTAEANLSECETNRRSLEGKLSELSVRSAAAERYVSEHSGDSELKMRRDGWEARRSALLEKLLAANMEGQKLQTVAARLKQEETELSSVKMQLSEMESAIAAAEKKQAALQAKQDGLLKGKSMAELRALVVAAQELGELQRKHFLHAGEPCPLCGSLRHPYCEEANSPKADLNLVADELRNQLLECEKAMDEAMRTRNELAICHANRKNLTEQAAGKATALKEHQNEYQARVEECQKLQLALRHEEDRLMRELELSLQVKWADFSALPPELDSRIAAFEKHSTIMSEWKETKNALEQEKARWEGQAGQLKQMLENIKAKQAAAEANVTRLSEARQAKFGKEVVTAVENELKRKVSQAQKLVAVAGQEMAKCEAALAGNLQARKAIGDRLKASEEKLQKAKNILEGKLRENHFSTLEDYLKSTLQAEAFQKLSKMLTERAEICARAAGQLKQCQEDFEQARHQLPANVTREENLASLHNASATKASTEARKQEIGGKLQVDAARRLGLEKLEAEIKAKRQENEDWKFLNAKFGTGNDITNFGKLAQGHTFQQLLYYANHLNFSVLAEHFTLVKDEDNPLRLNVIDHFHNDDVRTAENLSGGESFEVSLALALGLAEMSAMSQNAQLGNVFIDEGFGSLDGEALEGALALLEKLNLGGHKLVGIISHVERLQERIPVQIRVQNSLGLGKLSGAGVADQTRVKQWVENNPGVLDARKLRADRKKNVPDKKRAVSAKPRERGSKGSGQSE